jgi:DNA primase
LTDERELVRSRTDIVELVGQRVILKRVGKHFAGLCPFHDDRNPSFSVDPQTGRYRCWSCGESGDVFTWVMKTESVDYLESLRILALRAGITLARGKGAFDPNEREEFSRAMREALNYFKDQLGENLAARQYCTNRGLSESVLADWQIGFAPNIDEGLVARLRKANLSLAVCKELFLVDSDRSGGFFDKFRNRLMFPIFDERAQLVAFGGRLLGEGQAKYINSSDTPLYRKSRVLFGLNHAKESIAKARRAVLVEGYVDVIACHRAGATSAVASLGTSLTEDHAKLLKRFADEVTVLYDHDAAGQKAAERAIAILETEGIHVKIATLPEGDDPDTILKREGPEVLQRAIHDASSPAAFQIAKLERTLNPSEDEFWTKAVEILSNAPANLDREALLVRLAGKYPHIRDLRTALARLTKMVDASRKQTSKRKVAKPTQAPPEFVPLKESLQAAETIVFGALHEPKFQKFAWVAIRTPDMFETGSATALAKAISDAFPARPPEGAPVDWIHRVEPEAMRTLLSDISLNFHLANLTEDVVIDSIGALRNQAIKRELRLVRQGNLSAEERQEIWRKITILKPDSLAATVEDDVDPFS